MNSSEQWKYTNLSQNWNAFKQHHYEFSSYDYKTPGDVMYIIVPNQIRTYLVGMVTDVGAYDFGMFNNHVMNVLRDRELEYKEKEKKEMEQEKLIEKAKEEGEFWGQVFVAVCPKADVPSGLLWKLTSKLGKSMGFTDTDSNDAFKFKFMDVTDAYKSAQPKMLLSRAEDYSDTPDIHP